MATTYRLIGKGTTSNGVAHMTQKTIDGGSTWTDTTGYTGTGKGRLNLIASTDSTIGSGSLQSEPYTVIDALYFDDMSTDTTANYYVNTVNNSIAYDSTNQMIKITANTSTSGNLYVDLRSLTNDLIGKTVNIEVNVVLNTVSTRLRVLKNGSSLVNTPYTTSDGTLKLENVDLTETADSYFIRIETRNTSANDTFSFKNLKIYVV